MTDPRIAQVLDLITEDLRREDEKAAAWRRYQKAARAVERTRKGTVERMLANDRAIHRLADCIALGVRK